MKELRATILRMHSFGHSRREIATALHISQPTVHKAIHWGTVEDRPGRGGKNKVRTPENLRKAKARLRRNPSSRKNSVRKLDKALGISPKSAHCFLMQDLGLKSYRPLKRSSEWWMRFLVVCKHALTRAEAILNSFFVVILFLLRFIKFILHKKVITFCWHTLYKPFVYLLIVQ